MGHFILLMPFIFLLLWIWAPLCKILRSTEKNCALWQMVGFTFSRKSIFLLTIYTSKREKESWIHCSFGCFCRCIWIKRKHQVIGEQEKASFLQELSVLYYTAMHCKCNWRAFWDDMAPFKDPRLWSRIFNVSWISI